MKSTLPNGITYDQVTLLVKKHLYDKPSPDYLNLGADLRDLGMTTSEIQAVMGMIRSGEYF
jgi:hypothetical protein